MRIDSDDLARGLQSLAVDYMSLKRQRQAGFDRLDSYIASIRDRLGLEELPDQADDLRAIDAEICRLKAFEDQALRDLTS